jgi:pyridoxal phosphate enzyme (YggS family)
MIQDKIDEIRANLGPDTALLAVSKGRDTAAIQEVLATGQRAFGENRVQEAAAKWPPLRAVHPDIELHMIGPLQTNKAAQAIALFDVIQTLDRPALAEKLAKEIKKQQRDVHLYIEVNIGREPQKAGILPEDARTFLTRCQQEWALNIEGLMAIPPHGENPLPYFQHMKRLKDDLELHALSMGMSEDYKQAAACGSTMVRVGRGLFDD